MEDIFSRTASLFGRDAVNKLAGSRVAVFGLGGVGGYCLEALARGGIGSLDVMDGDVVDITNVNRQILALHSTVGMPKTQVAARRIRDINPSAEVGVYTLFYTDESASLFDFSRYDYIVDAIDTVTAKVSLAVRARQAGVRIISCMGTGNKRDATKLQVADIYATSVCPLARAMRSLLKKAGVDALKVVYSKELPSRAEEDGQTRVPGRPAPASCSFVPAAAGLIMAGEVIKDIIGD